MNGYNVAILAHRATSLTQSTLRRVPQGVPYLATPNIRSQTYFGMYFEENY